jgi:penicillin-binding protein 1A
MSRLWIVSFLIKFVGVLAGSVLLSTLVLASFIQLGTLALGSGARGLEHSLQPLRIPRPQERSTIYAADGSVLGSVYHNYNRQLVPLGRVNPATRKAVLAVEDHRFYTHGPIDIRSILRAFLANLRAGSIVQGGSTITQQLVKDTITGGEVTLSRKIQEAIDAFRVARTYSKNRILQMYLNEIYLGNGVYGVGAAAGYYFAEPVQDLTLAQSALLAAMIQSPARFDPIAHPRRARRRRNFVLRQMLALGLIDHDRGDRAVASPLSLSTRQRGAATTGPTSFWEQFVIQEFLSDPRFGPTFRQRRRQLFQGGLRIYTTLDPALEGQAQRVLRDRMGGTGMPQSALVSIGPDTGEIRALAVGNWSFGTQRYDLATDPGGGRSAGSAFKAFTLAAALESGISPDAVYNGDSPKTIPNCGGGQTWTVHNAEPGSGNYPLWLATADSVNAVFAQVIDQVGPSTVTSVAHRMGITSSLTPVCPLTLGTSPVSPLEMTSAYSTLANGGVHCAPFAIERVMSSSGSLLELTTPRCTRVMPADVASEETAMLENVMSFGTGTGANIGRPQAGKTGTGNNYEDAWFLGYVPQLATGVWVGYAKAELPMPDVPGYGPGFGGVLAAPIWHDFMLYATRNLPALDFPAAPVPFGAAVPASSTPTPNSTPTGTPTPTAAPRPSPTGIPRSHQHRLTSAVRRWITGARVASHSLHRPNCALARCRPTPPPSFPKPVWGLALR